MFGSSELMIIVLVVMVLFGATAIPKFARSLGQAKKEFKKGIAEGEAYVGDDKDSATIPREG